MKLHLKWLAILLLTAFSLCFTACGDIDGLFTAYEYQAQTDRTAQTQWGVPWQQGNIKIHFIDVGQGDCTFIQLPNARTMLVDAGTADSADTIVSYLDGIGVTRLDYVVATHPHADHIGSMAQVIRRYDVGKIYMPKATTNTRTYERLLSAIANKGLKASVAKAGVVVEEGDGLHISFLSPIRDSYDDLNNYSAVMKIQYNQTSFLFTGDAEREVERSLLGSDISADVLKVGHHGSSTSSHQRFINAVNPSVAVISVGADNEYGHPHAEALQALRFADVYRTDLDGTVTVTGDGESIAVATEKGN